MSSVQIDQKLKFLCEGIKKQFFSKSSVDLISKKKEGNLSITFENNSLWINIYDGKNSHSIAIPIPYLDKDLQLLVKNDVVRATCPYFVVGLNQELDYMDLLYTVICGDPSCIIEEDIFQRTPFIQQISYSIENGNTSFIALKLQKVINNIVNNLPLHEGSMKSWIMNKRLMFIDPTFNALINPKDRLSYQVSKAEAFFNKGWTQIGLPDGTMVDKNYMLKVDLKRFVPFGNQFHNPARNLYSTLGMNGDELPMVRSESMQILIDKGISRTGWNLFTVFYDIPDTWEDQIMVDSSHATKFITYTKRYQCFGTVLVKENDDLKQGQQLSKAIDGNGEIFDELAEEAHVSKINEILVNVGGVPVKGFNVIVSYKRYLKEGVKITNLSANKGVIRLGKLGFAVDPKTGEQRKIDVIVGLSAVKKRKNYAQIFEALLNVVNQERVTIVADDIKSTLGDIKNRLLAEGFPEDGSRMCHTYAGNFSALCGTVFWGVIHDVENTIWDKDTTFGVNGRGLRTTGLKFSTVEFRALETRFGKDNPVLAEVLSYSQGTTDLTNMLDVLKSKLNIIKPETPCLTIDNVREVDQTTSTIVNGDILYGTVVDEMFYPNGFVLQLPYIFTTALNGNNKVVYEGIKNTNVSAHKKISIDKLYIPCGNLRKSWRHGTAKYGLSEIGSAVNRIVITSKRLIKEPTSKNNITMYYSAISNYFKLISRILGTKNGELNNYGMAVRYPYSAKAVATLSTTLPKNVIEINSSVAKKLQIETGDVVLVERFPCLGFMSLRPQKIKVTEDDKCRYTIRVSGNSLGSMGLDFDGDVIYIAAFHTEEAKALLNKEWKNPDKTCYDIIKKYNVQKSNPRLQEVTIDNIDIKGFSPLTIEEQTGIVGELAGVKAFTGPVIAFLYNLMRILENSNINNKKRTAAGLEEMFTIIGESVFDLKHGIKSPHDVFVEAICTADINTLVENDFDRSTSTILCNLIKQKAKELGVVDLKTYHERAKETGGTIVGKIVREQNKVYFASRAILEANSLLEHLNSPIVDIPSRILSWTLSGKAEERDTALDKKRQKAQIEEIQIEPVKDACNMLCAYIEKYLNGEKIENKFNYKEAFFHN